MTNAGVRRPGNEAIVYLVVTGEGRTEIKTKMVQFYLPIGDIQESPNATPLKSHWMLPPSMACMNKEALRIIF